MRGGQRVQAFLAQLGQVQSHRPGVVPVRTAVEQTGGLGPVDQFDRAVVAQEQVPGDVTDRRSPRIGVAADGQQQLMPRRREPGRSGLLCAPAEKPAQPGPKAQEPFVLWLVECWHRANRIALRGTSPFRMNRPLRIADGPAARLGVRVAALLARLDLGGGSRWAPPRRSLPGLPRRVLVGRRGRGGRRG